MEAKPLPGRPCSLTPKQEQFRWINGRDPRQYGLDFGLWTRAVVADLIEHKFNIRIGLRAVGRLLAKLGLTPQKPLQRAYQRDPDPSRNVGGRYFRGSLGKPRLRVVASIFGMSPDFVLTPFTVGLGC